jgi:hypothetical protein
MLLQVHRAERNQRVQGNVQQHDRCSVKNAARLAASSCNVSVGILS